MTRKLFGTDGIRGTANTEPMTPETALKVAMAVGECFHNGTHKHLVVIGKDTRLSGYMLEPALTAGFITMGMDVVLVGPLPTPAIAMLTRSLRADSPLEDEPAIENLPEPVALTPEQAAAQAEADERDRQRQLQWALVVQALEDNSLAVVRAMQRFRGETEQEQVERVLTSYEAGSFLVDHLGPGLA